MSRGKRPSVIRRLRAAYPGEPWEYTPDEKGCPRWTHVDSGRVVAPFARLSPKYDGDDDSFDIIYLWLDTHEPVFGLAQAFDLATAQRRSKR